MLVGQQIGPFTIEKQLGTGAMGAVYRGIYTKTGQRVAVKVMLPGMGENAQSVKRFEREADILRQFRHTNIVRLFGVGKHQGMRYYAMEYVEGESLDRTLSRRGRLTWEEVITLGRQLCAALQHSHQQGVVHRDLKPSNLMILPDGTLKLTDFGIAKDLDVTSLTSANCTVGTASYMSPEQCRGERELTHKSDLYSLGIVFYELLTGKKPFVAENVMDMFMAHVQGGFERPSRLVPDIPKWLDTLVCQLLEKSPEKRPFDADTVAKALTQVLEKVEARQSAGVEAVRERVRDRLSGETTPGDSDRDAARTLLASGKKKRKKKVVKQPFYRRAWFQAVGIVGLLAALGGVLYLLLKPPGADTLYQRIERLIAADTPNSRKAAFEGPIQEYLRRYGTRTDDKTKQVEKWDREFGVRQAEEDLAKTREKVKTIDLAKMDDLSSCEREAVKASQAEDEGDLARAREMWGEIASAEEKKRNDRYVKLLAGERLAALGSLDGLRQKLAADLRVAQGSDGPPREPQIADAVERKAFAAYRSEHFGDPFAARSRWEELRDELRGNSEQRAWCLLAASQARAVQPPKDEKEKDFRLNRLEDKLAEARKLKTAGGLSLGKAEAICLDVQALYSDAPRNSKVAAFAREARELFDDIQKLRRGGKK